jgi:hypothetical protein
VDAIEATRGRDLLDATAVQDYIACVNGLLEEPTRAAAIGLAARQRVLASYSWDARLHDLDAPLEALATHHG